MGYQEPQKPGMGPAAGYKITPITQPPTSNRPTAFGDYYGHTKVFVKPDEEESKGTSLNTSKRILLFVSSPFKISIGYN